MSTVARIDPQDVRDHKASGPGTVLVCAYDSEDKFRQNHLDGAISLDAFEKRIDSIPKDQEIVFY